MRLRATLPLLAAAALCLPACNPGPNAPAPSATAAPAAPAADPAPADTAALVARGKLLVTTMGCNDCHTPLKLGPNGPEPDMEHAMSGHPEALAVSAPHTAQGPWQIGATGTLTAWSGPWGVSFAANLTPDEETGIGVWTEEMFIKAVREGKMKGGGRPILPPMPWRNLAPLGDGDLKAMFAYLKSLPAVKNHVPEPILAPPAGKAEAPAGPDRPS